MLDSLKKWLGSAPPRRGWDALSPWATSKGYVFRGVRKSEGFVVDGRCGVVPWRLEWGASQRSYVTGFELRLRAELPVAPDLQVLMLNRVLQESMEKTVFEQYVEGVQTRIDTSTPPEMRWLVMYPKLSGGELHGLRGQYAGVANNKGWLARWIDGSLQQQLATVPGEPEDPLVLMIARGRLMLRTGLVEPEPDMLERWIQVFETAILEARRVSTESHDGSSPSTQPSLWAASAMPADQAPR